MDVINRWYNYRTKEHDYLYITPEDLKDYIPQDVSSQALYNLYIKIGVVPTDAALEVLDLHRPK